MRLRELRLERFGHFSDCCHDFGEGGANADFHIILGPNESGKTTTMMGYLALLYGFERRNEPYAFRHERRNLSVSALLEFDGEVRQFTRVGGSKPDLRDAAGKPVPDYVLEDIIGNLSRDGYEKLFCLDDSTIEQGGKEIVNADGEMGKLLFGAMAGVSELSKVLDTARDEAVAMYRKSGKSRMRELKKEFNQLKREIGELDVSPAALGNMRSALAGAKTRLADAESKRQSLQQERASLSVKHKVLPLFAELDQLRARLATAEHLPHPLPIERDTLFEWQQERKQVVKQLEGLTQEIDELKARHADISIDAEALKLEKALRELEPLRSRCVIDADKLPTLASERDAAESDLLRALAELGVDADADVAGFICSPADIADLEALAAAYREAESLHAAEVKHLAECETELDTARLALAEFERHEHADMAIAELLEHFDAERLASEVAVAQSSIADAAEHWRAALDGLAIKGVNFSEVPDAPLDLAAAEALAARHDELGKRIDQARDSLDDLDSKTALVEAHIASMREDTGLASDDDVSAARKARDALWQRHIDSLDADTAARFHAAMLDVDRQMLDRLRQAEALGRLRELERSLEPHRVGIAREKQRLAELQRERQSIETRADDAADAVGISGLSPTGLLRWLQQHAEALDAGQRHRRVLDSHAATMERADALLAALREALGLQHLDFKGALDRARREASAAREQHSTIRERTAMIANLERQRDRKHGELSECTAARDAAGAAWEARVDTLFGGAVAPASLLPSLGTLHRLRQYEERRIVSVRELDRLVSERQRFSTAIHALGDRFELRHDDDMQLFEELEQLAHEAAASRQSRETLETEIAKRAEEHAAATEERERVEQNIADVAAQFPPSVPTDSPEALLSAFDKALDAIAQRKRVDELERRHSRRASRTSTPTSNV